MEDEKTYGMEIYCANCNKPSTVIIPKETLRKHFLKGKKCEQCGCLISGGK